MVDRLEELLALLEEEDENGEEQEGVPALKDRTVPVRTPEEDGGPDIVEKLADEPAWRMDGKIAREMGGLGDAEERADGGSDMAAELADGLAWRMDGKTAWETGGLGDAEKRENGGSDMAAELADGLAWRLDHKTAWETGGPGDVEEREDGGFDVAEKLADEPAWRLNSKTAREMGGPGDVEEREDGGSDIAAELVDGPVWRLNSRAAQKVEAVWRQELSERLKQMDGAVAEAVHPAVEQTAQAIGKFLRSEQVQDGAPAPAVGRRTGSGLESLYRQTVQASRPAPQAVSVEQAGRTFHAEEPGRTAALTVDELDRAVRRDSRRYDGGMMIF